MEIKKKTGISKPTIYRFLNGERIRPKFQEQIYQAALKIIKEERKIAERIIKKRLQLFNEIAERDLNLNEKK